MGLKDTAINRERVGRYIDTLGLQGARARAQASAAVPEGADAGSSGGSNCSRKSDVLDKIMSAYTAETWGPDAVQQIRDEIKTFVLAGHETSASMLAWSLYELSLESNKACLTKVLEESSRVFTPGFCNSQGHVESLPSRDALASGLVYTEMCLRESLRKYSVVPTVVRKASAEVQLGDYVIHKGSTIMVNMPGVHHNAEFWPEPMKYRPERFEQVPKPYTFIPFVDGPRSCLGQFLSLLESKVVLSSLLKKYRFELTNRQDAGLKHSFMIPIIPKTGHYFKVHLR
jgi:cytochrome P450